MRLAKQPTLLAAFCVTSYLWIGHTPVLAEGPGLLEEGPGAVQVNQPRETSSPSPPDHRSDATVLNSRSFNIPFRVDAVGTRPVEVQLYVSRGAGSSWQLFDRQSPNRSEFHFTADRDGIYWFSTRTVDAQGRSHPAGPVTPGLKVIVDTAQPTIDLTADADASGEVEGTIRVQDDHAVGDLQLRYATDTTRQWQPVDLSGSAADRRFRITPSDHWDQMSLHVVANDSAGNQAAAQKLLKRPRIATSDRAQLASSPGDAARPAVAAGYRTVPLAISPPTAARPHGSAGRGASGTSINRYRSATGTGRPAGNYSRQIAQRRGAVAASNNRLPPPATPEQVTHGFDLNAPAQNDSPNRAAPQRSPSSSPQRNAPPNAAVSRPRTPAEAMRPLNSSAPSTEDATADRSSETSRSRKSAAADLSSGTRRSRKSVVHPRSDVAHPRSDVARSRPDDTTDDPFALLEVPAVADRAPLRFSDSNRFSLDYELEAVGSSGVDAVELWGSLDGGESWQRWGSDPDRASPFDIETKGEGVFAFRIVVVGDNGLASPRPQPGESPDILIAVDQTAPEVRIRKAQYGEGNRTGSLVIHYECDDANPEPRPVSLSFSDSPEGPWSTIAAGLENDGDYIWPADPQLPRQLYLRIDGTDRAGNVGTSILDRPIDTQGLAPRARIRGFQPLGAERSAGASPGQQTATRSQPARK